MRAFTAGELTGLQNTQSAAMQDTCIHLEWSSTPDDYGNPAESWTPRLTYACGLTPPRGTEGMGKHQTEVTMKQPALRLPIDADGVIGNLDRVQITKRHGVTLSSPITYDVVGLPARGPSGLVAQLELVTDGSDD